MSTMAHSIGRYLRQFKAELRASCITCRQPLEGRVSDRVTWWCTCYHCGFSVNPKWTFDYYHPEVTGPEVEFFDPNDDGYTRNERRVKTQYPDYTERPVLFYDEEDPYGNFIFVKLSTTPTRPSRIENTESEGQEPEE